jgi:hypothetical protein
MFLPELGKLFEDILTWAAAAHPTTLVLGSAIIFAIPATLVLVLKAVFRTGFLARRRWRRQRIPRTVDLRLDCDLAPQRIAHKRRKLPGTEKRLRFGSKLFANIAEMKKHAPFKRRSHLRESRTTDDEVENDA